MNMQVNALEAGFRPGEGWVTLNQLQKLQSKTKPQKPVFITVDFQKLSVLEFMVHSYRSYTSLCLHDYYMSI